jgi:CubicO group peptidase (beta-lactamase class C family)
MKRIFLLLVATNLFLSITLWGQVVRDLPRSTPEKQGVSSAGIIDFLDAAAKSKSEFHSFMFLRHGKVVAEGWWNPFKPDLKHTMYSTSKSFTSTAVGFAVTEHLMKVSDKVISFFPELLPDTISPLLAQLKVQDLLIMSVGQSTDPTLSTIDKEHWVKHFLALPIADTPGTHFLYNSIATYMLSAIVQKVTGKKVIDYLRPRLFDPLHINHIDWETSPDSVNSGGWGLRLKTEDMAKFGQLYLQKGFWEHQQILPKEWVAEATAGHIDQDPKASPEKRKVSDWLQGYCYQFWRCKYKNMYRADGAFGQFIIVMPDQDAVIAITCNSVDTQNELDLVWKYLLPAIHDEKLPEDVKSTGNLKKRLTALALPLPEGVRDSPVSSKIAGKDFTIAANDSHIQNVSFNFKNDSCYFTLQTDKGTYPFAFCAGKWANGLTAKPGPMLTAAAIGYTAGLIPFKVSGTYTWKDDHTLELVLRYVESPHREIYVCHFDQQKISINMVNNLKGDLEVGDSVLLNGVIKV